MDARHLVGALVVAGLFALISALLPARGPSLEAGAPAGCSPARSHAPGTTVLTIARPEGDRTYRLHVPSGYDGSTPVPVIFDFHGATGSAFGQEFATGFSSTANEEGFVAIYPQGSTMGWGFTHFNALLRPDPEPDDVAFVGAILDQTEATLCVDAQRVYATGFSNGAWMAVRLACSLSDRIAAIAPVAGLYYPPNDADLNPAEDCAGERPVPVLAFHGTADGAVPFDGSDTNLLHYRLPIDDPDGPDALESWAAHDGCAGAREVMPLSANVHIVSYGDCAGGARVALYVLDGLPHVWPSASGEHGIFANDIIWQFFQDYTLDGPVATDTDGDTIADPFDDDDDGDSCADVMEMRHAPGSERSGGMRSPDNHWDFFDTDGTRGVDLDDVINVAWFYGTGTGENGYSVALDRSPPPPGAPMWETGPPDGVIDLLTDIFATVSQFGHECS